MPDLRSVVPIALGCILIVAGCSRDSAQTDVQPSKAKATAKTKAPETKHLRLFLPCGMVIPLRAVTDAFEKQHPGVEIDTVLDNAVVLAKRIIEKGETADLFVSPGARQLGMLEQNDMIADGSKRYFAKMTLTVAVPADNPAAIKTPEDLLNAETVSCPEPELNSAGYYAKQALEKLQLWDRLEPKMVFTEHAIQSHQFVARGKSQAGFMYKRCPLETSAKIAQNKVKLAFEVPEDSYGPAYATIAVLKNSDRQKLARQFAEFLVSDKGLKLIADNGLQPPPQTSPSAAVTVTAFYPDNPGHEHVKKLINDIDQKYGDTVKAEFVDFQSDAGFERWRAAGLTCGAILINGEQTVTIKTDEGEKEITFAMGPGNGWEKDDLRKAVAGAVQNSKTQEAEK